MVDDPNETLTADDFGLDGLDEEEEGGEEGGGEGDGGGGGREVDLSKMKMVLDVPLKVSVELGRTKLLINDLLQLGQGSVIELDKLAGEPMEIFVNDKLVAMGEVVVVNEKFGVRLTDVISGGSFNELTPRDVA